MDKIKRILQADIKTINQSIVETQKIIDKCFNDMLDAMPGSEEHRKAKLEIDNRTNEKWLYYGRLGAVRSMLKLIAEKEEADKLEIDYSDYQYCKAVGADELPF